MWKYKGCPRCRGDIFIDEDVVGSFMKCLQCGYEKEIVRFRPSGKNQAVKGDTVGILQSAQFVYRGS